MWARSERERVGPERAAHVLRALLGLCFALTRFLQTNSVSNSQGFSQHKS